MKHLTEMFMINFQIWLWQPCAPKPFRRVDACWIHLESIWIEIPTALGYFRAITLRHGRSIWIRSSNIIHLSGPRLWLRDTSRCFEMLWVRKLQLLWPLKLAFIVDFPMKNGDFPMKNGEFKDHPAQKPSKKRPTPPEPRVLSSDLCWRSAR